MKFVTVSLSLMVVLVVIEMHFGVAFGGCQKAPVIFNFGDSNSDTGGLTSGLGYQINPPNGRSFFGRPAGRLSDGRLIIDFLCKLLSFIVIGRVLNYSCKFDDQLNLLVELLV